MKANHKTDKSEVIILEADGKVDETNGYGYLIRKRLHEFGIKTSIIYLPEVADQLQTLPRKPFIISGGMTEVTAELDWIKKSKEFIGEVIKTNQSVNSKEKIPLLGICFGAQLIAESYLRGSVAYLEDPEIGNTQVILEKQHPLFKGFSQKFPGYTFHYNQILPRKEFTILSAIKHMNHHFIQAFEIPHADCFGIQFHPEFQYQEFITLMKTYRELIIELGLDYEKIISEIKEIDSNAILLKNFVQIFIL